MSNQRAYRGIGRWEYPAALTPEEAPEVLRLAASGDRDAMRRAVAGNMRLVGLLAEKFAVKYRVSHLREELVQSAISDPHGLTRAIERFDPSAGYTFSTFALKWIWWSFIHTLRREQAVADEYDDASADELDALEGCEPLVGGEDEAIEAIDGDARKQALHAAVVSLPAREREVISRRYGLRGREEKIADIAASMGLSHSQVQALLARAMRTLRETLGADAAQA